MAKVQGRRFTVRTRGLLGLFATLVIVTAQQSWAKDELQKLCFKDIEKFLGLKPTPPSASLTYLGIIPWKPSEFAKFNQDLVRYHGLDRTGKFLPVYDVTHEPGPAVLRADELRFSRHDLSDDVRAILELAQELKAGTKTTEDLPPVRVWKDVNGLVWTIDDALLAAIRLSGITGDVKVRFVTQGEAVARSANFSTQTDGKNILVKINPKDGDQPQALVVGSITIPYRKPRGAEESANLTLEQRSLNEFTTNYPSDAKYVWYRSRRRGHFDQMKKFAIEISKAYKELEGTEIVKLKSDYGRFGEFNGRGKSAESVMAKLLRKDFAAFKKGAAGIDTLEKALAAIGDGLGARLTFNATEDGVVEPKTIQDFVDQIVLDIKNGNRVTEIINYRPRDGVTPAYLSDAQVAQIVKADADYIASLVQQKNQGKDVKIPEPAIVMNDASTSKESGYTAFHMNMVYKSGVQAEFQIRGPKMNEAAEIEHFFYDLRSGKVLSEKHQKDPAIVKAAADFTALSTADKQRIMVYIEKRMLHARKVEAGLVPKGTLPPQLPADLPQNLTFEKIDKCLSPDKVVEQIKARLKASGQVPSETLIGEVVNELRARRCQ